jgi:hypothetical protein
MTTTPENFPAPFLGGPLTGKSEGAAGQRNMDSAALSFANCKAYGYVPLTAPEAGTVLTVDGESKTVKVDAQGRAYVDVLSRKGELIAGWFGYPGSEHLMIVHCMICDTVATVYNSHVRRGSSHTGCTARGKAARVKAVETMTGQAVKAPGPQVQPNGSTGRAAEAAPVAEATEATESADMVRADAAAQSADSRPAPEPEAQPPKTAKVRALGANQWRALDGMLHTTPQFGMDAGTWDSSRPGWHLGTLSGTARVMDALVRSGHLALDGTRYTITEQGRAAHAADSRTRLHDGGAVTGAERTDARPAQPAAAEDDALRSLLRLS